MKKTILTLLACLMASCSFAGSILIEGFEYANHDMAVPVGWSSNDESWVCGYLEKDHNRVPHTGNWYAFAKAEESWMFMPVYLLQNIHYRFSCWAISEGCYLLEFWAGPSANSSSMHTLLLSATIEGGEYEMVSSYVADIANNSDYIGIRAVAADGASYLTIDDLEIDMVEQYEFMAQPISGDTVMYPGSQGSFDFFVQNLGYDELDVYMSASHEFFQNVVFHYNGVTGSSFHINPEEVVYVTATGTLKADIEPGSISWLDVNFTIPCDCATGLATFWVNPLGTVEEFPLREHFDDGTSHKAKGWVSLSEEPIRWEWLFTGTLEDAEGAMSFRASETDGTSLLVSPKMQLNESDNLIQFQLYRSMDNPDRNDRVNVYYNTEMSLDGAQLVGTAYRNAARNPAAENEGWFEYGFNFGCTDPVGFLILEAVGDFGSDLLLDDILIDNTPLAVAERMASLSVYPNPTSDFVKIHAEGLQRVTVMDLAGRILLVAPATQESISLDLSTFEAGMYIITAASKNGLTSRTIVKQ